MNTKVRDGFKSLFEGNQSAYGLVTGGCVRMPVTDHCWDAHLFGEGSLGIYPVRPNPAPVCRWACTDIDLHGPRGVTPEDALVMARNLGLALQVLGHTAWVELTKSGGYHVWLFAADWVEARAMRNVMLLAHQLADVPVVEVNPKDAEGRTELGNYVNLPYARDWSERHAQAGRGGPSRIVLDAAGDWMQVGDFVTYATALRSPVALVHETASLYVPPPPRATVTLRPFQGTPSAPVASTYDHSKDITDGHLRNAVERLGGKGWVIFRDGPNQGGRAYTLFRLGVECRESGLTPDEALHVLVDADWRWGKFMSGADGHRDGIRYIEKMVEDIYG